MVILASSTYSVPTIVGIVLTILGLSGGLGGAIAFIRSNMAKVTLELYKEDNEALRRRVETLEDEKNGQAGEIATFRGKIDTLVTANQVLSDQVTGATAIREVRGMLISYHRDVVDLIRVAGVKLQPRHPAREEDTDVPLGKDPSSRE